MQTPAANTALLRTMTITMNKASNVYRLSEDCEIHVGGSVPGTILSTPNGMVVEPPTLYAFGRQSPTPGLGTLMQSGSGTEPKLLHGLFTDDIPSILKTLRGTNGQLTNQATGRDRLSVVVRSFGDGYSSVAVRIWNQLS